MLAAQNLCPQAKLVPCKSFYEVVKKLQSGEVSFAVLPIENTLQGAVTQNLDLLYMNPALYAVKEYVLKVDHRLISVKGARLSDVRRLYSHEQAILQCGKFIAQNLASAQIVYTDSTAESVSKIHSAAEAGIVGSHVRAEGMDFIGESISDEPKNFTHFLLIAKGRENLPGESKRVYFAATCPHEPGALLKMLQILSVYDLNMTKIESRPIKDRPGEYRFFIEFEGNIADAAVSAALKRMEEYGKDFLLLGCY